jgi:hypothetical protein
MKSITAIGFTLAMVALALVLGVGLAHASTDSDYIADLKSHGFYPEGGMSESRWESTAIQSAHEICGWAAEGYTRQGIKAHLSAKHPDKSDIPNILVDAAIANYCPQYWGQS